MPPPVRREALVAAVDSRATASTYSLLSPLPAYGGRTSTGVQQSPLEKQTPKSTRRNALSVKRIDGSLLMGHEYLACAVV